jgi:hypothetical protein
MLPILRIIPVGGVFFAILILVLALGAPDGSRSGKGRGAMLSARGPLQQFDEHPEWRQFLMQAALRRAEELNRLRELADEPPVEKAADKATDKAQEQNVNVAVLPADRIDAEPEDLTGSISAAPVLPVEIGETSSMELPNITHEEKPPAVKTPVAKTQAVKTSAVKTPPRVKPKVDAKKKTARHARRPKPPAKPPEPANFFEAIFGASATRQASTTTTTQPANQPAVRAETQTR